MQWLQPLHHRRLAPNQLFCSIARAMEAPSASPRISAACSSPAAAQALFGTRFSAARNASAASAGLPCASSAAPSDCCTG